MTLSKSRSFPFNKSDQEYPSDMCSITCMKVASRFNQVDNENYPSHAREANGRPTQNTLKGAPNITYVIYNKTCNSIYSLDQSLFKKVRSSVDETSTTTIGNTTIIYLVGTSFL